ncbi:hypothetical protein CAPTEDRAFT_85972, partial [Capitella teleta]
LPLNAEMEPTYRMVPKDTEKFRAGVVRETVERILKLGVDGRLYNARDAPRLACTLSSLITKKLKDLNMTRYKIVCNIVIGQNMNQALIVVSQCIWNTQTDTYLHCTYKTTDMMVVACVHAVY